MTDILRTRTIPASIGDIWNVLADFGSLSSWSEIDPGRAMADDIEGLPRRLRRSHSMPERNPPWPCASRRSLQSHPHPSRPARLLGRR